jgi:fumarate hydratase subunit beta
MNTFYIDTKDLRKTIPNLKKGDKVFLSGDVYTSRDAAHKRIFDYLDSSLPLPYPIKDSVVYYAGPTPTPNGQVIGSCGPTTSMRMDSYSPRLLDMG